MSWTKKLTWSGLSVAVTAVLAMALLVAGPAAVAHAATYAGAITLGGGGAGTATVLGGSSNPAAAVVVVAADGGNSAIPNSGRIYVAYPAGTTFAAAATTAANWTIDDSGADAAEAPASVTVSGTTLIFTLDGSSTVAAAEGFTINAVAAGLIYYPTAGGTTTISTDNGANTTVIDSGTKTLVSASVAAVASPTSIPADGVSTSVVTLTGSAAAAAANAADVITVSTSVGSIISTTAAANGLMTALNATSLPAAAPRFNIDATNATTGRAVTLLSPTTAGSAILTVYITPGGGAAKMLTQVAITLTAPTALPVLTSIDQDSTNAITKDAAGVTANAAPITITLRDQSGNGMAGYTVTVSTSFGVIDSNGTACVTGTDANGPDLGSDADCTYTSTAAGDKINVFGTNLPGTATVTIKATPIGATTPISVTRTVIFTGAIDTLSLTFQFDNNSANGAFAVSTEVTTGATPNSTTFTNGFRVGVTAKDTAGTGVAGFTPDTLTVAPATCATLGATTASSYSGTTYVPSRNVMTVGSAPAGTKCTVTAKESVTVNAVTSEKVATGEFTIGGTFSSTTSVMTVDATNMDPSTSQTVKVTVKDKDGVLIGDGTSVTLVASAGAVAVSTQLTANGVASFTYVSPGTAQSVGLTAVSGTLPAVTKTITVAAGAGAATGTGGFTGTAPAKGSIGLLVTSGASNAAGLVTALGAAGCTAESLAILEAGTWKIYINGAPAVVNTAFPASIAATTAFFVRCAA